MVDIKKVYSNMETALNNKHLALKHHDSVYDFKDFLNECDKVLYSLRRQAKAKLPIGIKRFLEAKIIRIENKRVLARKQLESAMEKPFFFQEIESIFKTRVRSALVINNKFIDPLKFFDNAGQTILKYVGDAVNLFHTIKVCVIFVGMFALNTTEEEKIFPNKYQEMCKTTNLKKWYDEKVKAPILAAIEEFEEQKDSGWRLISISNITIQINKYNPIRAGSWIDSPQWIKTKRAVINVRTYGEDCFAWDVNSALYPASRNTSRQNEYPHYSHRLDFTRIPFPVKLQDVKKFEQINEISVNVFIIEDRQVLPIHITKKERKTHVNLLMLVANNVDGTQRTHYCWIKNLSGLISAQCSKNQHEKYICNRCLHYFPSEMRLILHKEECGKMNETQVCLPKEGENILTFKNHSRKLKAPFAIYADIECLLGKPVSANAPKSAYKQHSVYSIGFYLKYSHNDATSKYKSHRGPDCINWFVKQLLKICTMVEKKLESCIPMNLSVSDERIYKLTKNCHICESVFTEEDWKVRDHCHLTGEFRGAAHNSCNLNFKLRFMVPVIFHNLTNYDCHFIISDIASKIEGETKVIPMNMEKYISFIKFVANSRIRLNFIDSYRFMSSSLDQLSKFLNDDKKETLMRAFPNKIDFDLLTQKNAFPYDYIDSFEKLEESELPPRDKFYNKLLDQELSEEEYERALTVYEHFECKTIGEYADLYLKCDVLLLTDIFENFRKTLLETHALDPALYFTLPGFTWDCMLKNTGIELELLTDIDMVMFVERGIRGGISQCSNRYGRANNKYMENYNPNEETRYLMYFDINNLYGWAMSQCLPSHGFQWVQNCSNFDVLSIEDDSSIGYILEVDISYPHSIHDLQRDLPMCPEHSTPPDSKHPKLLATLHDKEKYIIHYRNLKQAIHHGLELQKIHRVLKFKQSPWLKKYIDLNTELRKKSTNEFDKSLFKLLINACFGKCLESVKKRVDVRLRTEWDGRYGVEALISKPNFHRRVIFDDNLIAIEMKKLSVKMDKPIYVGLCVLEISKTLLYDFHYKYILPEFGKDVKLLYEDTDSFVYEFLKKNIYKIMKRDSHMFDTSNYPPNNVYGIELKNKALYGLMKDECQGIVLEEFIGLRSKMYALKLSDRVIKKAKGVKGSVVNKTITLEDYKNCLFDKSCISRDQHSIRSNQHVVYSVCEQKLALSPYDDKRCIINGSTDTLPWGYKDIMDE